MSLWEHVFHAFNVSLPTVTKRDDQAIFNDTASAYGYLEFDEPLLLQVISPDADHPNPLSLPRAGQGRIPRPKVAPTLAKRASFVLDADSWIARARAVVRRERQWAWLSTPAASAALRCVLHSRRRAALTNSSVRQRHQRYM